MLEQSKSGEEEPEVDLMMTGECCGSGGGAGASACGLAGSCGGAGATGFTERSLGRRGVDGDTGLDIELLRLDLDGIFDVDR